MKALSIAQPWAECIVAHGKNVENRTWKTKLRGYFAIHASKGRSLARFRDCDRPIDPDAVPYGAIVGFARLTEIVTRRKLKPRFTKWFGGPNGFVLDDVIRLAAPVTASGGLGFWRVTPAALRACFKQLSPAERTRILRGPTLNEPGRATWIVKARDDRNGAHFLSAGRKARWITRKPPKDWSAGDTVLFWRTAPHLCVIGAGRLLKIDERDRAGDTYFRIEYLTNELANPIGAERLRRDAVVGSASFLKSGPAGTLFLLTDGEVRRIATLALKANASSLTGKERRVFEKLAAPRPDFAG